MEWIETTGVTLDEAKERALDRLGVAEDELEVEVLVEASRSMLGLKKTEARLRARVRPTSPRPKAERRDRNRRNDRNGRGRGGRSKDQNGKSKGGDQDGGEQNRGRETSQGSRDRRQDSTVGRQREESGGANHRSRGRQGQRQTNAGTTRKTADRRGRNGESAKSSTNENGRGNDRERADVETMDLQTQARITEDFVQGLLDRMGLEARVASRIE